MASIEKRRGRDGQLRYRVKIRRKGAPTISETFGRLTDARAFAQRVEVDIAAGRHLTGQEAKKHTMGEAIQRYINSALKSKAPNTQVQQASQLRWWERQVGFLRLADLTPAVVTEQRDILEGRLVVATVRSYMSALSSVLEICVREWGWLEESPMRRVRRPTGANARIRFLDDDERERLLVACQENVHPYLYLVVVVALSTGCRKNEILNLRWENVNLAQGAITLHRTKNKRVRRVPLRGQALELMRAHAKVRRLGSTLVFPGRDAQRPVTVDKAWRVALRRAGVSDFRFHDLRHSAASYLAMNGATPSEIAEILGHRTLAMVQRYAHLSESHVDEVVGRMNRAIFGK
jgi:integrase